MNQILPEVIADILAYKGAEVEKKGDGGIEILSPPEVSSILNIPEYVRLTFSYGENPADRVYASYDSEFFRSISHLLSDTGRFAIASLEPYTPNSEKMSKAIKEKLAFGNATFRLDKTETSDISYLLCLFRYSALSDEKHEGILPILINEKNLSSLSYEFNTSDLTERFTEPNEWKVEEERKKEKQGWMRVFRAAHISAIRRVEERMKDFIKSLERRLNRDIRRVYEYYESLKSEARIAIGRKIASSERDGEIDKLRHKLEIIEAEQKWKVQDLIAKYALSIRVEPAAMIKIETKALFFWINIKRRLASRQFPLTYNPVVRQLDPLPCESCFNPHGVYYVCDDKLHILCGHCMKKCPSCGKQYCSACYNDKCPGCKNGRTS